MRGRTVKSREPYTQPGRSAVTSSLPEVWREAPLATLAGDRGHAAFLGYLGMVLGLHRLLVPDSRFATLHDRVVSVLERRVSARPVLLIET